MPASSSPTRASYDLTVRGDALLSALAANSFDPTFGGQAVNYATEQGDPSHLRGLAVQRLRPAGGAGRGRDRRTRPRCA